MCVVGYTLFVALLAAALYSFLFCMRVVGYIFLVVLLAAALYSFSELHVSCRLHSLCRAAGSSLV